MKFRVLVVALLLVVACGKGNSEPKDGPGANKPAGQAEDNSKYYSVAASPEELPAGQPSSLVISFVPADGYKWNNDFPTSFSVVGEDGVEVTKKDYVKAEVEVDGGTGRLVVPLVPAAGAGKVSFNGNFSVCNETSCKIFKAEAGSVIITGTP